ncbi:MAG: hypothetical protein H6713_39760 [Myxococcales bacterium]|nr:hypothetical protein [Myxococcales bacterium]MCB9756099.1 hypothetical protein [Myxococcales bacterium]
MRRPTFSSRRPPAAPLLFAALALAGCGDSSAASESDSGTITGGATSATEPSTSAGPTAGTIGGSGSTSDASGTASESGASQTATETESDGVLYDVGSPETTGTGTGDCTACGFELDFSHIWIANAEQGTVSKIDTTTMEELGRYITRPDGNGNPSRTSVNFNGDVAVANRHGGLTKIYARHADCDEMANGQPGLQTSSGADDILPWGQDDCIAWYTPFNTTNQRPVAWEQGTFNPDTCKWEGARVWTVTSATPGLPGLGGPGGVIVYRLNGDSGAVEDMVPIETFPGAQFGAYGGAVDSSGNLWFVPQGLPFTPDNKKMAFVNGQNLAFEIHTIPQNVASYGITVDADDYVWVSSTGGTGVARYNPFSKTWDYPDAASLSLGGLAQGADELVWVSTSGGAMAIEPATLVVAKTLSIPDGGTKGVGVDRDGFVWLINETTAYKCDSDSNSCESYDGLTAPYTYSDMTGFQLKNTTCGPPT